MKDFFETMKLRTTLKRVYLPSLLAVILLSVSFRIAAIFANYNSETGYFENKILINIASIIVITGCVFTFSYAFTGSKRTKLIPDFSTPATYVPTGALTVAMMFFALMTYIKSNETGFSIREYKTLPGVTSADVYAYITKNMSSLVLSIMAPMACLAVIYFILTACVLRRGSTARAFFGTANVLFLAFYTSYLYFDTSTFARNAPNRIVDQMAFLFAALFFLYEIRISLGREKWNLYIGFGFVAAALTAYSSIPSLTVYFVNGEIISNNIQENVLSFALFIFILSRIVLAAFLKEDKESESIGAIREYAKERRNYIKSKEDAAKRAYMELYADLNATDDEENGEDNGSDEAVQITFDEALTQNADNNSAETELLITEDINEDADQVENTTDNSEFIQESIDFNDQLADSPIAEQDTVSQEEGSEEKNSDETDNDISDRNI